MTRTSLAVVKPVMSTTAQLVQLDQSARDYVRRMEVTRTIMQHQVSCEARMLIMGLVKREMQKVKKEMKDLGT